MFRYGLAAALTVSGIAFVHSQDVVDRSGLLGSCTALAAGAPSDGQWLACRPGMLTGYPDLSQDACTRGGMRGEVRYWLCPTALVGARTPNEAASG
jgi:hypothetical protein